MKKIFVGGYESCGIHSEKDMIESLISKSSRYEITDDYKDADTIIIIDTCMSTYDSILWSIDYIENVLRYKKDDAVVVVSGCLTKGTKFELTENQKDILNKVVHIEPSKIMEYVARMIGFELSDNLLDSFKLPYTMVPNGIQVSPVVGCLNHCSFCKSNYMNFNLNSVPYQHLERMSNDIDELNNYGVPLNYICITSSNLSLYGIDLYKKRRAHEAIKLLTSPDSIKFAEVGALINWYPELINEILENSKIKSVFTSLESGSPRVYGLMNRPISLDKWIEIVKLIRKNRPDIIINTEFICGYPTESIDDLKKTIDLIYELDVNPQFMHPFHNSPQIPGDKLPQHSYEYCLESVRYAKDKLLEQRNKYIDFVKNGEMLVLDKDYVSGTYIVMLIDGSIKEINFSQFDRNYKINDLISSNSVKCKQLVKNKK